MIFRKGRIFMKKTNPFFYCLGQGIKSIGRNKVFSLVSIATVAACIFLIGMFMAAILNMNHIVEEAQSTVCVTVFFEDSLSEEEILEIGAQIRSWPEVASASYTSADQAWLNFKNEYFRNSPELAEGFADDNPLANSASYDVYLEDVNLQDEVCERLEATAGIRQVNRSEVTASALSDLGRIVGIASAVLIIILLAVSVFLIANTIVTGITMRKEEIRIMKYVGATDFFVKSPFIFEGVIIGLIGALIPLVIIFIIYNGAAVYIMDQLQTLNQMFTFISVKSFFKLLVPVALVIGAGIGLLGSSIATGRHLKV